MKVLVVGGRGRFGDWFARLCREKLGDEVTICDVENEDDLPTLAAETEIAILAVPLPLAPEIAGVLAGAAAREALIVDVSSMKMPVFLELQRCRQSVALLHPMCAPPDGLTLDGHPLVVAHEDVRPHTPVSDWYGRFREVLGGVPHRMTVAEHDRAAKILQPVVHAALLGIAEQIAASGISLETFRAIAPPVAAPVLEAMGRHLRHGSVDVFEWLQAAAAEDKSMSPVLRLGQSVERLGVLADGNPRMLRNRWTQARDQLYGASGNKK